MLDVDHLADRRPHAYVSRVTADAVVVEPLRPG